MIVADTNAIVYLFVPGAHTPAAETAADKDPAWVAPALWRSEMRSALSLYLRKDAITRGEALRSMARAEAFIKAPEREVSTAQVLDLVVQSGCSAYDCEFVALASDLGIPLLTSDAKVLGKFPHIAVSLEMFSGKG